MPSRQDVIAQSITHSILHSDDKPGSIVGNVPAFFHAYWLTFDCVQRELFKALRGLWQLDELDYRASLGVDADGRTHDDALESMGDMGFSGSTFFIAKENYIVKSIPRRFEHSFFKNELLLPYADYMRNNPRSLLVRITDFLQYSHYSMGSMIGLAPSHHIVMENIQRGKSLDQRQGKEAEWETFDLKPQSYFYPERDVAGGILASEATKSKLADDFDDKVRLTLDVVEEFKYQLQKDTAFLAKHNAVDYSLFLLRIPRPNDEQSASGPSTSTSKPPYNPPEPQTWRTGIKSADGKYVYRAVILDFFWSKHKVHAQAMTGLIKAYNIFDRQGPMSVTTTSPEYRARFSKMCTDMLEVQTDS